MKKAITSLVALCALFTASATTSSTYETITASEAQIMMDTQEVIIVDVRNQNEYDAGHIPNAILLPLPTIQAQTEAITKTLPNKDAVILVHCRSGARSASASKILAGMGYTNIYDFGGINDWKGEVVK